MARIIVVADHDVPANAPVLHAERVAPADFESEHFARQLAERLAWAVGDARAVEDARPRAA